MSEMNKIELFPKPSNPAPDIEPVKSLKSPQKLYELARPPCLSPNLFSQKLSPISIRNSPPQELLGQREEQVDSQLMHKKRHKNTVTSITKQMGLNQFSQLQSPTRQEHFKSSSKNFFHPKHLSLICLPRQHQYRPSNNLYRPRQINQSQGLYDNNDNNDSCAECGYEGDMDILFKLGWVAKTWIVFMLLTTLLLFWVPLIFDRFKVKEFICPECGNKVGVQNPTCL